MPDPQLVYFVTAFVVVGLVAWVIVVLARGAKHDRGTQLQRAGAIPAGAGGVGSLAGGPPSRSVSSGGPISAASAAAIAKNLDPHDEIQDDRGSADVRVDVEEEEEPTGPHALILVTAVGRTDPGLKRKHNEDAYTILENHHLFVIADGMGRHAAGEIASQLCVDAIGETFNTGEYVKPDDPTLPKRANQIRGAILNANARILEAAQANEAHAGMGTTVVAAYFSPNNQRVYIAHVGDSRCYRCRGGKFTQLTMDHTLGAAGIVGKSAAVLSRAVGVEEHVDVDVAMESPLPGDVYLLCSDGLSRMVTNEEIFSVLSEPGDLDAVTKRLIDMANERGGRDNITAILVRVEDAKRLSTAPPLKR